ncbi:MAG: hypothetical protein ACLR3U_07820 [Christensenellaceae bacterium]
MTRGNFAGRSCRAACRFSYAIVHTTLVVCYRLSADVCAQSTV